MGHLEYFLDTLYAYSTNEKKFLRMIYIFFTREK